MRRVAVADELILGEYADRASDVQRLCSQVSLLAA
jgi:hypothetical protein